MEYGERNGYHVDKSDFLLEVLEIIEPDAEIIFGLVILVAIFVLVMWIVAETTKRTRGFCNPQ